MSQIKTFARLKPTKKPYHGYVVSKNVLTMHIPDSKDFVILGPQSNYRSNFSYDILFTNIFGCEATQEEVFDGVAKGIIQNFLNGYNGTIFAYGQTGTGKTYTVEGNTNKYNARGLATRALSMIYQELEKRSDQHISVYLSYLEIYQEVAYDLLNPAARSSIPVAPFARVTVVEGPRGSCILRGLSLHLAANEEIAQMLLLQGQANRKVAETPVNQRSSRSHAVFTVYLQVRRHDSDVLVNSKLHLVDLAGSERVSKTGVDGQQLTEAKSINLSLHHLETVIIALQLDKPSSAGAGRGENPPQQSKSNSSLMSSGPSSDNGGSRQLRFVPYRNSLLTMVLKDSLGGNCLTAMIATISLEPENLGESISTCRFAQRVARIANHARKNEEVDNKALIKRLKNKVAYLENQVALLRSKGHSDHQVITEDMMDVLTDEDHRICERIMEGFLQGVIADPIEAGISDQCRFRACLHMLKHHYLQRPRLTPGPSAVASPGDMVLCHQSALPAPTASSSTLQAGSSTSWADLLANNPQQDSGDYAANRGVHSHRQVGVSREGVDGAPRRSERHNASLDNHHIRTSQPLSGDGQHAHGKREPDLNLTPHQKHPSLVIEHSYIATADEDKKQKSSGSSNSNSLLSSKVAGKKSSGSSNNVTSIDDIQQSSVTTSTNTGSGSGRVGVGGSGYKSPFERRREKEIKRLSRKLTEMEEDQASKENCLQEMKEQAIVEELLVAEAGLRLKLQVAEEQVADQHAYLLQLKHLQADPELIAKEQLVEKQLRKRQAKFQEKLTKVLASKESLEKDFAQRHSAATTASEETAGDSSQHSHHHYLNNHHHSPQQQQHQHLQQQSASGESSSKTSLEERYGQYKQGKGSLNTRQVFDLLKSQEKKQQKESQKLERETTLVKTKQLAIKEAATLEKLRELKQMLKISMIKEDQQQQQQQQHQNNYNQEIETDMLGVGTPGSTGNTPGLSRPYAGSNNSSCNVANSNGGAYGLSHSEAGPSHHVRQNAWGSGVRNGGGGSGAADQNRSWHNSSSQNLLQGQASSLSSPGVVVAVQQQSETAGVAELAGTKFSSPVVRELHPDPRHSYKFFQQNDRGPKLSVANSSNGAVAVDGQGRDMNGNNAKAVRGGNTGSRLNSPPGDSELLLSDLDTVAEPLSSLHVGEKAAVKDTNHVVRNGEVSVHQSLGEKTGPPHQNGLGPKPHHARSQPQAIPAPVVPPSEYIHSMSSQEQFDARRMGLSSRTFESALSHMLDNAGSHGNAPDLPYTVDPYEEYSRSPPRHRAGLNQPSSSSSPYQQRAVRAAPRARAGHGSSLQSSVRGQGHTRQSPATGAGSDHRSAWGPESMNASVADRLAHFLDPPSTHHRVQNGSIHSDKSQNDGRMISRMDAFESKLAEFKKLQAHGKHSSPAAKRNLHLGDIDSPSGSESDEKSNVKRERGKPGEDDEDEDRSFFGLEPEKTKLRAMTEEEGEKTFLSTVAAEKARVEKIRRARNAAEVIQRRWRKHQARQ